MQYETQFRSPAGGAKLLEGIRKLNLPETWIMEVCGTHTMAIAKAGLRQLLPPQIHLISGPGCPVCVTPAGVMDEILRLSENPDVILTTYGDLMRVPGSVQGDNLQRRSAMGANVRMVYSPMDCLELAAAEPNREVVFLGVGFETTAPGTAIAVCEARERGLKNFSVLCLLKRTEAALRALIASADFRVNGFLCPGHVATIVGANGFRFLAEEYQIPSVIGGFETGDLLAAVYQLLRQIKAGTPRLENEYTRAVSAEGNVIAQRRMAETFLYRDDVWRGLGSIPESGYGLRPEFAAFDAEQKFAFHPEDKEAQTGCQCGDIICGRMEPTGCPLFGTACVPENPVGPCMVSSEGACAAAYKYQRL